MPRDIPIGNGNILAAFDLQGLLREFHFPHIGEENHTLGAPFRWGLWVDGQFTWLSFQQRTYLNETLVTNLNFTGHDLKIQFNDLVDFEEDIYLRKITIENLTNREREIRLFAGHDFSIYGNSIGDTAAYFPENKSIFHYKGDRYFLINVFANHMFGVDMYATGNKDVWKDAEDGVLSSNPIAQGSVGSVVGIPIQLSPNAKETCYYWIAAAKTWNEVKLLNEDVKKRTPDVLFTRTHDFWKFWMTKEACKKHQLSDKIFSFYRRSLGICKTQMNAFGSIIASNDSDAIHFNQDTYSYMWPRDGAFIANAFDLAGYEMHKFYQFCTKIVEKEGYFLHKYTPTGALASSWLPWVKQRKAQLPIQEDETALVIWALWKHYEIYKDLEFIRTLYSSLIKKCANFMMNYRDPTTGLPLPSYDLWEEREGILTFTVSTVYGGLIAAAQFTELFGEKELAEEYRLGAKDMRSAMDKYLYLPDKKRFARMVNFEKGAVIVDDTLDASLYATFAFGAYDAHDEKVKNTMEQIIHDLASGGGIARYQSDTYYRQTSDNGNPWFICTLWVAQYYIAISEFEKAKEILEWVVDHALPSGVLAEQINPSTGLPLSVSPLTWSHGAFIATVELFCRR
ncbi:MAG TPA: glycoside hydrolase family 15 protein [Chlamydiales bacterium]|nr:glycoside hydrolase family 15 protein [Chlamydiales bacterium]